MAIVLLSLGLGCQKADPVGFGGSNQILGRVFYPDSLTNDSVPASHAQVLVGFDDQVTAIDFSYKTFSDSLGYFAIKNLLMDDAVKLLIIHKVRIRNQIVTLYQESETKPSPKRVNFLLGSNGATDTVSAYVKGYDFTTNGRLIPMKGVKGFVGVKFNPTEARYTYKALSVSNGEILFRTIKDTKADFRFYFTTDYPVLGRSITLEYAASSKENIRSVVLRPSTLPGIVGIRVVDKNNTPQPNISICLFSNRAQFKAVTDCSGSIFSGLTNAYGFVFVPELQAGGKYYLKGKLDKTNLVISDSIVVNAVFPLTFNTTLQ